MDRLQTYLGRERPNNVVVDYYSIPVENRPYLYCYDSMINQQFPTGPTSYYQDMTRYIHYQPQLQSKKFLFYPSDRVEGFKIPTLVKSRPIYNYEESILLNMNYARHFEDVYNVDANDIDFKDKTPVLVWRGADTGYGFGNNIPYRPVSRQKLVEDYFHHQGNIDVGLSIVDVNNKANDNNNKWHGNYTKPNMNMKELLQYKYLLSVEGNDVATNLKWILYSKSVPFCPPFTMNSWILEEKLMPWRHYIPVNSDFSDLEEKVIWADHHPEHCEYVAKEGRIYMEQFLDLKTEKEIIHKILKEYATKVKISYIKIKN